MNAFQELLHLLVFFESVPSGARKQTVVFLTRSDILGHTISAFFLYGSIINFYNQFLFSLPFFLGDAVNLLLRCG